MKSKFSKTLKICMLIILIIDFFLMAILQIRSFVLGFGFFDDQICNIIINILYFVSGPLLFVLATAYFILDYAYKRALEGMNNKNIAKIICVVAFFIIFGVITIL